MTSKLITEKYRALNTQFHQESPKFGAGGHVWAPFIALLSRYWVFDSVLDYGAGKGTLKKVLNTGDWRMRAAEYDPAIPSKSGMPQPADLVCCLDVMEHVEPECLDAVLQHIFSLARKAVLFDISCIQGDKKLPDGRFAHVLVRDREWWRERLNRYGHLTILPSVPEEFAVIVEVNS